MNMKKSIKTYTKNNEKGAITLFILLSILFFIIILFALFYNLSNRNIAQNQEIENIKKNYDNYKTLNEIREIYNKKVENTTTSIKITLDNEKATENGTISIYQKIGDGIYLDNDLKNEITTTKNPIEIPKKEYIITYNYNYSGKENSKVIFSYDFKGYYTERDGKGTQLISEKGYITSNFTDDYFKSDTNNTLYAKWEVNSINLQSPTRSGYNFEGWFDSTTGGNKIGTAGQAYTPTGDITLYAQWTVKDYNITFDNTNYLVGLNDVGNTNSDQMTYSVSNKVVTVTANANDGRGYVNARVYLEAGKKYIFSCTTNGIWGVNDDTVEAYLMLNGSTETAYYYMATNKGHVFTPEYSGVYYLRLDVNQQGKTYTFSNIEIKEVSSTRNKIYGETLGDLPTPSRPFYTFNGWYTSPTGGNQVSASTTVPASNTTYYAHWTEEGNGAKIENITSNGYDVYVHITDASVTTVRVPTWTVYNGQDDLLNPYTEYYLSTKLSETYYYFRVNVTDHNSESGLYNSHVYGYDASGTQAFPGMAYNNIMVPDSPITINFTPNGNSTYSKTHSSVINSNSTAANLLILKGKWVQGTTKLTQLSDFNDAINITDGYNFPGSGATGDWYLWIYAQDDLGNEKIACSNVFKFDNTAPSIPTVIYNGGANTCTWKNNYNITLSSSDSHSGIDHYEVDWTGDGVSDQVVNSNFIPWNGYSSCNNRFRAVDKAGNVSAWTEPHHIHMDTEAPSITNVNLNGYVSGTWTANDVTQTASATDNIGVAYYQYSNNGGVTVYDFPNPFTINWDGYWDFYVRAVDAAGNIGPWSAMYTINRTVYQINNASYITYACTLQDAINLAEANATIYLLKDITDNSYASINRRINFSTNGHTIYRQNSLFVTNGGFLYMTGSGTINISTATGIFVQAGGKATFGAVNFVSNTSLADVRGYIGVEPNAYLRITGNVGHIFVIAVNGNVWTEGGIIQSDQSQNQIIYSNSNGAVELWCNRHEALHMAGSTAVRQYGTGSAMGVSNYSTFLEQEGVLNKNPTGVLHIVGSSVSVYAASGTVFNGMASSTILVNAAKIYSPTGKFGNSYVSFYGNAQQIIGSP